MKTRALALFGWLLVLVSFAGAQWKSVEIIKKESSITYLLSHPLHHIEATSHDIVCRLEIDPAKKEIRMASVEIDVTTFDSGNSNRDSHAMEVIDAITYPDVQFTSTSITQHGDSLQVFGKLTFHGVTKDIMISAATTWSETKLLVQGNFDLSLTDFKIERPSLLMIKVDDTLKFTLNAVFNIEK
jgi:polyisoprenoid-binding protein YceI